MNGKVENKLTHKTYQTHRLLKSQCGQRQLRQRWNKSREVNTHARLLEHAKISEQGNITYIYFKYTIYHWKILPAVDSKRDQHNGNETERERKKELQVK